MHFIETYGLQIFFCVVAFASIFFGFAIGSLIWITKYYKYVVEMMDSMPEGKILFINELSDAQCQEVLSLLDSYCIKEGVTVNFAKISKLAEE